MTTKRGARNLKIIKVKSEAPVSIRLPNFPPLPRLYLELLENKEKVKPQLRDLEWESKNGGVNADPRLMQAMESATQEIDREIITETTPNTPAFSQTPNNPSPATSPPQQPEKKPNKFLMNHRLPSPSTSVATSRRESEDYSGMFQSTPKAESSSKNDDYNFDEPAFEQPSSSGSSSDKIDDRMAKILRGEDDEDIKPSRVSLPPPSFSAVATTTAAVATVAAISQPPSLNKVLKGEVPGVANVLGPQSGIANLTITGSESQNKRKNDLLFKFKLLRKSCPEAAIPEFPDWTDVDTLEKEYEQIVRQLKVDSTVEDWKKWLTIGCLGLEFVLTNLLKWSEMAGFTQNQLLHMNKYEKVLIEIGEKRSLQPSRSWPPEVRLAGMMFMNAAIFIGTKMFFQKTGPGIMSMLAGGLGGGAPPPQQQQTSQGSAQQKPKMKGPDFDIDEILKNNLQKKDQ